MNSVRWQQKLDKEQLEVICLHLRSSTAKLFLLPEAQKKPSGIFREMVLVGEKGELIFGLPSTHSKEQILH